MAPPFDRAAAVLEPDVRLLKLNADEAPNVSARLGVRGIPAMFLFRRREGRGADRGGDGHVVHHRLGAPPPAGRRRAGRLKTGGKP